MSSDSSRFPDDPVERTVRYSTFCFGLGLAFVIGVVNGWMLALRQESATSRPTLAVPAGTLVAECSAADFGTHLPGKLIDWQCPLRNAGLQPITIRRVQTHGYQASAFVRDDRIEPGQTSLLQVRIPAGPLTEDVSLTIEVDSTATNSPHLWQVSGRIEAPTEFSPALLHFGALPRGATIEGAVRHLRTDIEWKNPPVLTHPAGLSAVTTVSDHGERTTSVHLAMPDQAGPFQGWVRWPEIQRAGVPLSFSVVAQIYAPRDQLPEGLAPHRWQAGTLWPVRATRLNGDEWTPTEPTLVVLWSPHVPESTQLVESLAGELKADRRLAVLSLERDPVRLSEATRDCSWSGAIVLDPADPLFPRMGMTMREYRVYAVPTVIALSAGRRVEWIAEDLAGTQARLRANPLPLP